MAENRKRTIPQILLSVSLSMIIVNTGHYLLDFLFDSPDKSNQNVLGQNTTTDDKNVSVGSAFDSTYLGRTMGTLNDNGQSIEIQAVFKNDADDSLMLLAQMHRVLHVKGISLLETTQVKKLIFSREPSKEINLATLNINTRASEEETSMFIEKYAHQYDRVYNLENTLKSTLQPYELEHTNNMTVEEYESALVKLTKAFTLLPNAQSVRRNLMIATARKGLDTTGQLILLSRESASQMAAKLTANKDVIDGVVNEIKSLK